MAKPNNFSMVVLIAVIFHSSRQAVFLIKFSIVASQISAGTRPCKRVNGRVYKMSPMKALWNTNFAIACTDFDSNLRKLEVELWACFLKRI